jgi:hypothetical protein
MILGEKYAKKVYEIFIKNALDNRSFSIYNFLSRVRGDDLENREGHDL